MLKSKVLGWTGLPPKDPSKTKVNYASDFKGNDTRLVSSYYIHGAMYLSVLTVFHGSFFKC